MGVRRATRCGSLVDLLRALRVPHRDRSQADKALRRLPRNTAQRIRSKLLALAEDPFARSPNIKKLTGREGYRLRIGNWRALYTIDPGDGIISVMVIKPRGGAYD